MKKISLEVIVSDDVAQEVLNILQKLVINKLGYYNLKMEYPETIEVREGECLE